MAIPERAIVAVPLVLSVVALILSALALFAGRQEGFLEEYAIARVNVTGLGHDLISSNSGSDGGDDDDDGGLLDGVGSILGDIQDSVVDQINDIVGNVADDVTDALGIQDWYSLHVMTACEGKYKPDASAPNPGLNTTSCSQSSPNNRLNVTALLEKELSVGPVDVSLSDLGWNDEIQEKVESINKVLLGLFILYVIGMAASAACVLTGGVAVFAPGRRSVTFVNLAVASLGSLVLSVASVIDTMAVTKGFGEINDAADNVGVRVGGGRKFLALAWAATAVANVVSFFWTVRAVGVLRRQRKMAKQSKAPY